MSSWNRDQIHSRSRPSPPLVVLGVTQEWDCPPGPASGRKLSDISRGPRGKDSAESRFFESRPRWKTFMQTPAVSWAGRARDSGADPRWHGSVALSMARNPIGPEAI